MYSITLTVSWHPSRISAFSVSPVLCDWCPGLLFAAGLALLTAPVGPPSLWRRRIWGECRSSSRSVRLKIWDMKASAMKNCVWENRQNVRSEAEHLCWARTERVGKQSSIMHFLKLMHHTVTNLTVHSNWATVWEYSMFFVVKDSIIDSYEDAESTTSLSSAISSLARTWYFLNDVNSISSETCFSFRVSNWLLSLVDWECNRLKASRNLPFSAEREDCSESVAEVPTELNVKPTRWASDAHWNNEFRSLFIGRVHDDKLLNHGR